jgi:hypothetical protein
MTRVVWQPQTSNEKQAQPRLLGARLKISGAIFITKTVDAQRITIGWLDLGFPSQSCRNVYLHSVAVILRGAATDRVVR